MIHNLLSLFGHAFLGLFFGAAVCACIYYRDHKKHQAGDITFLHGYIMTIMPFSVILGLLAGLSWWALLLIAVIVTPVGLMMVILDGQYYLKQAKSLAYEILPSYKKYDMC
jgi:amino acid transporter